MSLENPLGLARSSKVESPETKKALDMFRSKLFGAMALGYMAFLEACGGQMTKEDIEKMPTTSLQDVIKDPKSFANMPIVKIEGYPVMITKEITQIPIPRFNTDSHGNITFKRFDWISQEVDCYDLHQTSDLKSPSFKACADGTFTYFPYAPINIAPDKMAPHFSNVVGRVEEWGFGKAKQYVFSVKAAVEKSNQQ